MVAIRLEGQLGNQLFQYAFIYAAAKKLKTGFYIDKSVDYLLLDKYFNIENDFCRVLDNKLFSIAGYKNIFSHYSRWAYYSCLRKWFLLRKEEFSNYESPAKQLIKIKNNRLYIGFFQSEEYFLDYHDEMRQLFEIKDFYQQSFKSIFDNLPKASRYITVHIRRGDYATNNLALPVSYYHKAIESVGQQGDYYIFISDDSDFVKGEFSYLSNKYVSESSQIIDFQFLMHADVCILSSSSFSWWGAWLNKKPGKTIYAPENWLGFKEKQEFPAGIADHQNLNWIQV